jgi:amino acid adenylation domain-containing protein
MARLSEIGGLGWEDHSLLEQWNDTAAPIPTATVHALIDERAREDPDAIAVTCNGLTLTFCELVQQADQLAARLAARAVGRGDIVAVCTDRGLDLVVALLGILRSGAAYLPVDDTHPEERREFTLVDAHVRIAVTDAAHARILRSVETLVIGGDVEATLPDLAPPQDAAGFDDAAYVIYTSGSSGRPKGVVATHGALVNLVVNSARRLPTQPGDVWRLSHAITFDYSVWDLWTPLVHGATVAIGRAQAGADDYWLEIAQDRVTVLPETMTAFRHAWSVGAPSERVRSIVLGGERVDVRGLDGFPEWLAVGERRVFNFYGPTECTVWASAHEVSAGDVLAPVMPIGRPLPNLRAHVLDGGLRPVPVGARGELFLAGVGLARGYLGRAGLTAERFVPDPFAGDGSRMYRTGDIARFRNDGALEFHGRVDDQVKVRGYRIEPGEIEAVLLRHHAVRDAAVAVHGEGSDARLVGYVVERGDGSWSVSSVRAFVRERLPEFMVPSVFVVLDGLPLNRSGKVDRRALPVPAGERPVLDGELVAPRSPLEEVVAGIWAEVLGLEVVGVEDDFFDLGGHSLLVLMVVDALSQALAEDIPLVALFDHPTVRALAEWIGVNCR